MKKIYSVVLASAIVCGAVSAQSVKVANTFGAGGSDLFVFENQKNEDDSFKNIFGFETRVCDRIQVDAKSEKLDGRIRMDIGTTKVNGKESTLRLRAYGRYKFIEQLQLIVGNEFFTKVPVDAGYLAASDDYPTYARILQKGFGLASNFAFGDEENISLKIAGGIKAIDDSFFDINNLGLDAGLNFGVKDLFTIGLSTQNITGNKISLAAFAGLSAVENLTLNLGYIYNNTDTGFIPKSAKNSISFTAGYDFQDIGLFLGCDVISAISNEYITSGETAKYENAGNALVPFYSKVRLSYSANESLSVNLEGNLAMMLGDSDSFETEVYPNVSYKLPAKMGDLSAGFRMNMNSKGIAQFSIPLSWKITLIDISK